jgi:hypothetical protein
MAAPTGLDNILAGAASGPPNRAKVMEITLKLRADSGNAAVLTQLTEQVKSAAHKAIQEAEHLGEALVKKAHGWPKEMGEAITKALEKAAEEREKAERKEPAKKESGHAESPAGREVNPHPGPGEAQAAGKVPEPSRGQEGFGAKKPEEPPGKEASGEKGAKTEEVFSLLKNVVKATSPNKEAADAKIEQIERLQSAVEAGQSVAKYGKDFAAMWKAASVGKDGVTALGFGGTALNLAKGGLASVGGWGGIAATAQVAGIGAVAIAGGVALHDGFKTLLNKVGFLGGNFDTLSGTVMEWNESTKRSAEIEKKIAESQEAHQQALEQMQRNQQNVRSVYEARERIEESQKHQKEAGGMAELAAQYAGRFKEYGAGRVASERELQERDKKYAAADRSFVAGQYAKKFKEKGTEHAEAAKLAGETDRKNKQPRGSQGGASQLASDGSQGRTYTGPVDLQEQVLREEKAVKLANEMRDLARDRSAELQSQLAAMDQQVRAAEHQVAATREQLKVEQERELSEKARMSMMSKEDQRTATEIFKKIAQGKKIDRSDALFLQQRNLLSGSLGHKASDRLAEDLDPEFVKWRKAAGGEGGLEKAQEHLAESTHELADEQKKAKQTLQEYMETLGQFAASADTAMQAQKQVEDTKSRKEGYSNPEDLRPGEKRHHTASAVEMMKTIQRDAHADFLGAINEFVETTVTQFKKHAAHVREVKQRLNRAHDQ